MHSRSFCESEPSRAGGTVGLERPVTAVSRFLLSAAADMVDQTTDTDLPYARMRILITGAAGSGTSTLARALGPILPASVVEADDYFWLPTSPPFSSKRDPQERLSLILRVGSSNQMLMRWSCCRRVRRVRIGWSLLG